MRKLAVIAPDPILIEAYVEEIARGYGIEYVPPNRETDNGPGSLGGGDQPEGKVCHHNSKTTFALSKNDSTRSRALLLSMRTRQNLQRNPRKKFNLN